MSARVAQTKTYFDANERIWHGPKGEVKTGKDISLGRLLMDSLLQNPDHIAQICDNNGKRYTNKDIATLSIRVAQSLQDMGIEQGDIIGVYAGNTDYLAPVAIGTFLCGAVLSTLDPSFDKDGIKHIFSMTKPKVMFCDGKVYERLQASLTEIDLHIPIYTMKDHHENVRRIEELITPTGRESAFEIKQLKHGSEQVAAILCSSGTTGLPKGVCLSHESLINIRVFNLCKEDRLLCFSTLYWISGVLCMIMGILEGCTRVITDQPFSGGLLLRMIEEYKITIVCGPPSQMAIAVQCDDFKSRDLSSLTLYLCGGSAVPFSVIQTFLKRAKNCLVLAGYGMTEIGGICSFGTPNNPGSNGQLGWNVEVKIVDESDNRLGIDEAGEVCIRTPLKWSGYFKNPEATDKAYNAERWSRSGDIGYFDKEGNLFIVDRKKDILKYNNFHFSPTEIEEVIMKLPDVVEVCACGIPDIVSSFLPAAAVVKLPNSTLTEIDISNYVAERMADFKQLRGGVYFVDSIPKTASGKNVRAKITTIVENMRNQRKGCRDTEKPANGGAISLLSS